MSITHISLYDLVSLEKLLWTLYR